MKVKVLLLVLGFLVGLAAAVLAPGLRVGYVVAPRALLAFRQFCSSLSRSTRRGSPAGAISASTTPPTRRCGWRNNTVVWRACW